MSKEKKQVGGGWKKVTDNGTYISLSFKSDEIQGLDLSDCWISLVKNNYKKNDKHPDYTILATPKNPQAQKVSKPSSGDDFGF